MIRPSVPDLLEENEALRRQVTTLTAENERLHFDYERLAERKLTDEVDAEKALADDLADVLMVFAPVVRLYLDAFAEDELMTLPEKLRLQEIEDAFQKVTTLLVRYREARGDE
jgi:hypothetical protein